ncbi:pelle-like serine/threonine-protein kinase pik-1 [Aphidius gifuensis]|nr:pelle-like serine/threonine-protein kinase pik-1 [Aphidius gifuensis]
MQILQACVDKKYHYLLIEAKDNLSNLPKAKVQCVPICQNKMTPDNKNNQITEKKIMNIGKEITPRPVEPSNSNNLDVKSPSLTNLITLNPSMTLPQMMEALKPAYLQHLAYKVLTDATDNWSDAKIIGKGGFGKVFKGSWVNTDVAIKRLERTSGKSDDKYMEDFKQYLGEINSGASCKHDTLLPIYAYSMTDGLPSCIVYQIMANGSLEDRLALKDNTPALNWLQRHNIAKFVAQGLQFMHSHHEKPLIHGDIKSANVLLDANMNPKIGDFGLARRINNKEGEKVDKLQGTKIYLPLDYLSGKILSPKVDTYSYGCVMYELATGLRYDQLKNNAQYKRNPDNDKFNGLIDQKAGHWHNLVFDNLIEVGNKCTQLHPKDRPYMDQVYNSLVEKTRLMETMMTNARHKTSL